MNSFQQFLTVNCFFTAKNGELHQTIVAQSSNEGLMNARNLIGPSPIPQAKFVKFFTI